MNWKEPEAKVYTFEDMLEEYGYIVYTNVGVSMMPLLRQGRDLFTVRKKGPERCKVGDVVLYKRPPDKYVLHRIVEVRDGDYVLLGDNCICREYGIRDADIVGVMTGYVRNGRRHSTEEAGYRLYRFVWLHTIPLRIALKKALYRIRRGSGTADKG